MSKKLSPFYAGSLTKENHLAAESIVNKGNIYVDVFTLLKSTFIMDAKKKITEDVVKSIYNIDKTSTDIDELVEEFERIFKPNYRIEDDDRDPICNVDEYGILYGLDQYLTSYVNHYLKYVFNSKSIIDSVRRDFRSLVTQLKACPTPFNHGNYALTVLNNVLRRTMRANYKLASEIVEIIDKNVVPNSDIKVMHDEDDKFLYAFPYIKVCPSVYLRGFKLDNISIRNAISEIEDNTYKSITREQSDAYELLSIIHSEYDTFQDVGHIELMYTNLNDAMPTFVSTRTIFRLANGDFRIIN